VAQVQFHVQSTDEIARALEVDPGCGLETAEAKQRLFANGPNRIAEAPGPGILGIAARQLLDATVLVLIAAAGISAFVHDVQDTAIIAAIVMLNTAIATVQEVRARKAIAALRKLGAQHAAVLRNAIRQTVPADELVTGDVVLLEVGNIVPADLRLIEAARLAIAESPLTGESVPVHKQVDALGAEELPLGDRTNMAFKGTMVTSGRGRGIVVATGPSSELGRIGKLTEDSAETATPLQQRLTTLGKRLSGAVVIIAAVVFAAGLSRGEPAALMFLTAVSLAVAAIPEALPATLTISLALGARRMSDQNALVRRLAAVEALGSVSYICTDKTGTLTEDRMRAEAVVLADGTPASCAAAGAETARAFHTALALCNDVLENAGGAPAGDPTEVAVVVAAAAEGFDRASLVSRFPRVFELPFEAERKRMTTVHAVDGGWMGYTKGAPEAVIPACRFSMLGALQAPIDRAAALALARTLAARGLRVLAVAQRHFPEPPCGESIESVETELTLLGFIGLIDPPRAEAAAAVSACRAAGIVPVMITGDHPDTAQAIADRLGLADPPVKVIAGPELTGLGDKALDAGLAAGTRVFARVDPAQKIRIVEALQRRGAFVAMTGDGVNDAPALRRANIGVAMGRNGTDVAREAADLVLLDDNFATIVAAIGEGRRIYDNVRKFLRFMLTGNSAEIWTMLLAPFLGLPIPLLPAQILWINLVTDSLPALAIAVEPAEGDVMRRPPRPPAENILGDGLWQHTLWVGLLMAAAALAAQAIAMPDGAAHWQTMVFSVLTFSQLGHVMVVRSDRTSLFEQGLFSNLSLLGSVALVALLQLAAIYLPLMNAALGTTPLTVRELSICITLSLVVPLAVEIEKVVKRMRAA
jgi:Ca2+-transporting ATPase